MSKVEELSQEILRELLSEFVTQKRSTVELSREYMGMPMATLRERLYGDSRTFDVDFDLALDDLVKRKLIGTGPLAVIEPPQISGVVLLPGLRSKKEYAYLNENGYKAAQKTARAQGPTRTTSYLHISGGTFNQSPIGLGDQINQSVVATLNSAPVFADLRNAIVTSDLGSGPRVDLLARIDAMEEAHRNGGFKEQYKEFVACAANHMTVILPFIPALTALLR